MAMSLPGELVNKDSLVEKLSIVEKFMVQSRKKYPWATDQIELS